MDQLIQSLGSLDISPQYVPDPSAYMGDFGVGSLDPTAMPEVNYAPGIDPSQYEADYGAGPTGQSPYQGDLPVGGGGGGGLGSFLQGLNPLAMDPSLLQMLILLGGLGAAGSSLFGPGSSSQFEPRLTPTQKALLGQATGSLAGMQDVAKVLQPQELALYGQGSNLLQGLMSGGQVPTSLSNVVNAAYEPYIADIATNAIESARRRGFYGGLGEGPAAAIASPALANLPGLKAQTTLNTLLPLSQQLLGQGQQAFTNQQSIANTSNQMFAGLPGGSRSLSDPGVSQRIQDVFKLLGAAGTAAGSVGRSTGLSGVTY